MTAICDYICDYSGDYKIGITDALGILREAAGLGSLANCPTIVSSFGPALTD